MQVRFPSRVRLLPVIYLVLSLPVILFQVFATPPFQVADEENHFLRAVQIADGHPFAYRLSETGAGGDLDPNAVKAAHAFDDLKFHAERKLDTGLFGEIAALRWDEAEKGPASFANTAIYPFFFYLPASFGLALGRLSGLTILDSFYLGRLFTALCATFLAGLAIATCARGRSALFVILCFPMVLSLFAGITQDALSIASGALVVAIWSRHAARNEDVPLGVRSCAAVLLGAIIAARIPLLPVFGLLFLPTSAARRLFTRSWMSRDDLISCAIGLVPIGVGVLGARAAKIAFKPDAGVSPSDQLAFILHHPGRALWVAIRTLEHSGTDYLHQMVGVLGWLDTELPSFYYSWAASWLLLALAVECLAPEPPWSLWCRFAQACFAVAGAAAVFGALYLAWTPVADPVVDGVQGRYLFVPAIFALLVLPGFRLFRQERADRRRGGAAISIARGSICAIVAAANVWIVPTTVLHRFYG